MRALSSTPALVSALNSVDLPALVYPTRAIGSDGDGFAALALLAANAADIFQLLLNMANAAIDFAAIGFQLSFTGAAGADAAAELRHLDAASGQSRQQILQLRQFHLQLAFPSAGVAGEDVEDKLGPVENARIEFTFQVALLRGRELVIEDNQVGRGGGHGAFQLFQFAAADERGGIGLLAALQDLAGDTGAGAGGQFAQLGHRFFGEKTRCSRSAARQAGAEATSRATRAPEGFFRLALIVSRRRVRDRARIRPVEGRDFPAAAGRKRNSTPTRNARSGSLRPVCQDRGHAGGSSFHPTRE